MKQYRKIDIYVRRSGEWVYVSSTERSRTCEDARARYAEEYGLPLARVKARFA